MDASLGLGLGDALDAMRSGLELEARVHVFPGDAGDDFLVAAVFTGALAHHLHVPAVVGGVIVVHAEQVAGEDRRLIAAGGGADFEKDVAVVVRVFRQQQRLDIGFKFFDKPPRLRDFLLRHLADGRIFVLEHGLRGFQLLVGRAVIAVQLHHRIDFGVFLRQLAELVLLADDFRVGEQPFNFLKALRKAGEPCFDGRIHAYSSCRPNRRRAASSRAPLPS